MDYSTTLNLPRTDFPMRAGLPLKEPLILKQWEKSNLYLQMLKKRKDAKRFILHDGPPYANGDIHMGTALNKVLKDMINKYKYMQGYAVPYVPGWDTHGLPVEHQVIKTKKVNRKDISDLKFRGLCRDYALHYLDVQREQFKRLGVIGDWENPYITLHPSFEASQVGVFGKMAQNGYIYKGLKPVYWCPQCETALAEAEVEYAERRSPSIFVKFEVTDNRGKWEQRGKPSFILIWTTTPWTIPANLAIALHPGVEYALVETEGEHYLLASQLVESVFNLLELSPGKISHRFAGAELKGVMCSHPLYPRESLVVLADYVNLEQGTGCVHTAPGHGQEDFETGMENGLPIFSPLDGRGVFTEEAGEFKGLRFDHGNKAVTAALKREKALMHLSFISHQYPHCWRCKKEVIFRATEQWFASIEKFRKEALQSVKEVQWVPPWGQIRMHNMIAERRDWCISRQRVWGVPLPVFYCCACGEVILNERSIAHVQELFAREGSDAWYSYEAAQILPPDFDCPACGQNEFRKEHDIMDVWFDSGSSHAAVLETREELGWPADLYLEGSDQFRGWFQSSLLTSVATRRLPPYKGVLSHGWVVDGEGRKMSKSLGNVIAPEEIISNYGADILRLWVSSADFTSDIHLSSNILKQLTEVYRKIRNTCRFLISNLYDFHPAKDGVEYSKMDELDRWALHRLYELVKKTKQSYALYEFHQVFHAVHNFAVVDMSNFYLDIIKDRLYVLQPDHPQRRATQTVLAEILRALILIITPVLSFTAEEAWSYLPFREEEEESVLLASWPELPPYYEDEELAHRFNALILLKSEVNRVLETKRKDKYIGNSLQAAVELYPSPDIYRELEGYAKELSGLLLVSSVILHGPQATPEEGSAQAAELNLYIQVKKATGNKCQRCWNYTETTPEETIYEGACSRCSLILEKMGL